VDGSEPTGAAINNLFQLYLAEISGQSRPIIKLNILKLRVTGCGVEQGKVVGLGRDAFTFFVNIFKMQHAMVTQPMHHHIPSFGHARTRRRAFPHFAQMNQRLTLSFQLG